MAEPPNGASEDNGTTSLSAAARMVAAREAAGLSVQDVADKTRVPLRHLISLEKGDYGALPGTTYCAGFARAYARAVGLDEGPLVAVVRAEIDQMGGLEKNRYEYAEPVNPARVPPRWLAWTAAILIILAASGYGLWRMQLNTAPTDNQFAEQAEQAAQASSPPERAPGPVRTEPVIPNGPVVLTAADSVWLRIYQPDGTRVFEGTLTPGESYTVPDTARAPMILTGRPDALAITIGGQSVPPLGTAERTISDVQISAAALLARANPAAETAGTAPAPTASSAASSTGPSTPTARAPTTRAPNAIPTPALPALDGGAGTP